LGIEPACRVYEGDDLSSFVVDANINRRHLSINQRALIGLKLKPLRDAEAKARMVDGGRSSAPGRSAEKGSTEWSYLSPSGRSNEIVATTMARCNDH
jgi:hypothetical protein